MRRFRSNLAPVLWLAVFAAILSLWAGSYWWSWGASRAINAAAPQRGIDMHAVGAQYGYLGFFSVHIDDILEVQRRYGFSFQPVEGGGSGMRGLLWQYSDERMHFGIVRWCRKSNTRLLKGLWGSMFEIHYAPLAAIAGFFTWRSWRKRRRRHARGFEVASADGRPPTADCSK